MTIFELANEMLAIGTELVLVYSDNPKVKLNRPRTVVGRRLGCPHNNGLFLQCKNDQVRVARWPREGEWEFTSDGFVFFRNGQPYAQYAFKPEVFNDGLD